MALTAAEGLRLAAEALEALADAADDDGRIDIGEIVGIAVALVPKFVAEWQDED